MQDERFIVSYPQTGRGMMPAPAHRERMEFFWYLESLQGHCKDIINPYLITEKKKGSLCIAGLFGGLWDVPKEKF